MIRNDRIIKMKDYIVVTGDHSLAPKTDVYWRWVPESENGGFFRNFTDGGSGMKDTERITQLTGITDAW